MASIVDDEPERRRRMLSEPSHTGVVGRSREAKKKQSNSDVSTDVTNQRVLKRVEYLGTEVKRRRHHVRRSRALDEHVARERTARSPKQGGSEAIRSKSRLKLNSSTSENQASESSPPSSRLKPNYKPSSPDRSHVSFTKNGNALVKPEVSPAVGSLSNDLSPRSNRSYASTAISRRSARANNASMPPDMSPMLNPNFKVPSAETRHHSREDGSVAWATPTDSSTVGSLCRGSSVRSVASPATFSPNARNKEVSKSPGKQSKLDRTVCSARHICPACAAKNDCSNIVGSNSSLRSKGTAEVQNKNMLNFLRLSRQASHGLTAKQDGSNSTESNSPVVSKRVVSYKKTYMPPEVQSSPHAIQRHGVTRKSSRLRSSSNVLSSPSLESLSSPKNSFNDQGANRRSVPRRGEVANTSSHRDFEASPRGNGTHRRSESTLESVSPRSFPSTSMVQTRNSIIGSNRSNRVYPDGRRYGSHYADGDESRQDSHDLSSAMDKVVDSIRSTAWEILSSDVEDVCLSGDDLKGIAESQKVSVETLIDGVSDKLDDLEDSLFGPTTPDDETKKPAKSWFPKIRMKVIW